MKRPIFSLLTIAVILVLALAACAPQAATTPAATNAPAAGGEAEQPTQAPAPAEPTSAPEQTATEAPAAGTGGTIKVGTNATFPPFETVDEATKELVGFDIDLMEAVAEKAGFTVEWANMEFDPMLAGISTCQIDLAIAGISITPEREANMLFSEPYINAGLIVVVGTDNSEITGIDSLTGKTVGAQIGTTGAEEAAAIEGVTAKTYDSYDLAFLDLINGQIDAVIADNPTAIKFIGQSDGQLKTAGDVFVDESYGIAICSEKADLKAQIDAALTELEADGTIAELEQKWLVGE